MDLRQLRYFVAVAKARNFTRASEALHIAQPALSRQVQLLEQSLNTSLLYRNSRPLQLTEAGKVFYEQAIQILGRVEQLKSTMERMTQNQRGVLSIGFVPSILYGGLPSLVRKLRQSRAELDIQLIELSSVQQNEALKTGRIDVGFGRVRSQDAGVERVVLREERLVAAIPPRSPLARTEAPIELQQIAGESLLVYPNAPRPSFADTVLSLLDDVSVRPAEVIEVRELQSALGLVAAEAGVCLVPTSARLRSDVHYRLVADERATSPVILSHRSNDSAWYIETIKTLIQRMYAENPP
ncbi:MAG: LysR family transcriptional regulator [Pigmentiphaga sp.]|nr:LysR family transcriptional regulator [Pigmentiphaga sp.]